MYGVDLVNAIFRSAFARDTPAPPQLHGVGDHQLQLGLYLVFLQDKVNSARYIALVVNSVLLLFHGQEDDIQLPWPARSSDLSSIVQVWGMMKWELNLSPEPVTIVAILRQQMKDAWDNLSQGRIRHLYDRLLAKIHACVAARKSRLHCVLL